MFNPRYTQLLQRNATGNNLIPQTGGLSDKKVDNKIERLKKPKKPNKKKKKKTRNKK